VLRRSFTRRRALTAGAAVVGAGVTARLGDAAPPAHQHDPLAHGSSHSGFPEGNATVDPKVNGFDPTVILRDFDWGKTRRLAGGHTLREWELVASDKEIEIVPGVKYAAWTYNGRVPGPTLRAREGDLLRIRFINDGTHPHTIHFHGMHPAAERARADLPCQHRRARPDQLVAEETITVSYPWIHGESYEIELMTSTGRTVGYDIEDA
jgi:FtsP/CotA-like multicopper oxidase with cupredoxin domain